MTYANTLAGDPVRPPKVKDSPAGYIALATVAALLTAFPKAKHRGKLIRALVATVNRLGASGQVVRLHEGEAVARAMARAEAATILGAALDELETQEFAARIGDRAKAPVAAGWRATEAAGGIGTALVP